jgi:uncharacterized membrane protein YvbJ
MAFCSNCGTQLAEGVKFCTSCGAAVGALDTKCPECGHEFRNRSAGKSVTDFFELYRTADPTEKANIVKTFPIPNTREDILTFLTMGIGNTKQLKEHERDSYETDQQRLQDREAEIIAWQAKVQQTIDMGKMLFPNAQSQALFQKYEKQLTKNSKKPLTVSAKVGIGCGIGVVVLFCAAFILIGSEERKETDRLNAIVSEVNIAIENSDYDSARLKASYLNWKYSSGSKDSFKKNVDTWDLKRETLLQEIDRLKGKK